jgi:hypothetical protein
MLEAVYPIVYLMAAVAPVSDIPATVMAGQNQPFIYERVQWSERPVCVCLA